MAHKRYVYKNGRKLGPYYYESYREGGKVKKRYIGKKFSGNFFKLNVRIFIFLVILILIVTFFIFANTEMLGRIIYGENKNIENDAVYYTETKQYKAIINRPVKWVEEIDIKDAEELSLMLPKQADKITIRTGREADKALKESEKYSKILEKVNREDIVTGKITGMVSADVESRKNPIVKLWDRLVSLFDITGRVIQEEEVREALIEANDSKVVKLNDIIDISNERKIAVEYYTDAPVAVESIISGGKRIAISAPDELGYEDVLAYTELENKVKIEEKNKIKLYHVVNGEKEETEFDAYDLDEDGKVDYVEWNVPHLSEQIYELIIEISKAEHLDSSRQFISDIYNEVNARDGLWSELINNNEYVRVTFKQNLSNKRDITIYAKSETESEIEVYEKNSDKIIAKFTGIKDDKKYRILLSNMSKGEREDEFDLRIISAFGVEIDYIVDPAACVSDVSGAPDTCDDARSETVCNQYVPPCSWGDCGDGASGGTIVWWDGNICDGWRGNQASCDSQSGCCDINGCTSESDPCTSLDEGNCALDASCSWHPAGACSWTENTCVEQLGMGSPSISCSDWGASEDCGNVWGCYYDETNPAIDGITLPISGQDYNSNTWTSINFGCTDDNELSSAWYSYDAGVTKKGEKDISGQSSYAGGFSSITYPAVGNVNLRVYCKDTAESSDYLGVSFIYSQIPPSTPPPSTPTPSPSGGGSSCIDTQWTCGNYSKCINRTKERICTSNCNTQKTETQNCTVKNITVVNPLTGESETIEEEIETPATFSSGGCTSNIQCLNWSECVVSYSLKSLQRVSNFYGTRKRGCEDKNRCVSSFYEYENCSLRAEIFTNRTEYCGKSYIELRDLLTGEFLARIFYSQAEENPFLNIDFYLGNEENVTC